VTDSGFSVDSSSSASAVYTSVGFVLSNTNTYVGLRKATVLVNVKDAAGNLIYSGTESVQDVAPGTGRPTGFDISPSELPVGAVPTSVELFPSCRDAATLDVTPDSTTPGAAQAGTKATVTILGTVSNTGTTTISGSSSVHFVTRDISGKITAGGRAAIDGDVPAGAGSLWKESPSGLSTASQAVNVQAVLVEPVQG
jgi:hypothetical protein